MRPVIEQIESFDATKGISVKFFYGGDQSYGSTLTVYNVNDFSRPVYTNQVTNMNTTNAIAGNVLKNGTQYAAEIVSYNRNGEPSEASNKAYFWCYATPVFKFTNVSDGDIITVQTLLAKLYYNQSDGIEISRFKFLLYKDYEDNIVDETDYYTDYERYRKHQFKGLENNHFYYIQAKGQTTRFQDLDTGIIPVYVMFESPGDYSVLYANSDNGDGIINYNTNIRLIESTRPKEDYYFDNGFIYLQDDTIAYETNFVLDGDFIMAIRHKEALGQILKCSNDRRGFDLSVVQCSDEKLRYRLSVPNEVCKYILYSEPFDFDFNKIYTCWIKRVNNLYEIRFFEETDISDVYNLWLGTSRPAQDLVRYDVWINAKQKPTIRIAKDDVVVWKQLAEPTDGVSEGNIWIDVDLEGET